MRELRQLDSQTAVSGGKTPSPATGPLARRISRWAGRGTGTGPKLTAKTKPGSRAEHRAGQPGSKEPDAVVRPPHHPGRPGLKEPQDPPLDRPGSPAARGRPARPASGQPGPRRIPAKSARPGRGHGAGLPSSGGIRNESPAPGQGGKAPRSAGGPVHLGGDLVTRERAGVPCHAAPTRTGPSTGDDPARPAIRAGHGHPAALACCPARPSGREKAGHAAPRPRPPGAGSGPP